MSEDTIKEELRKQLQHIEDCLPAFTSLYFTVEEKALITEQLSTWRWYISHGWFPKPFQECKKPPLSWLLQELLAFPRVWDSACLLAAPGLPNSLNLEQAAETLKHQMRRITAYPGEIPPIPSTFNLPKSDPRKTDQYGVPWAKSECEAARNWRKSQAKTSRELEARTRPAKTVIVRSAEEIEADLKLKNQQREDARQRHEQARQRAEQQWRAQKHGH